MGKLTLLEYTETAKTTSYLKIFNKNLNDTNFSEKYANNAKIKVFISERFDFIRFAIFNKEYRKWIVKRATDKNWQQQKLVQLGFKSQRQKTFK